jgi:hypothetical protein
MDRKNMDLKKKSKAESSCRYRQERLGLLYEYSDAKENKEIVYRRQ